MHTTAVELLVLLLLIVLNGVFALPEIAIVSARKARLQERASRGDAGARVALEMAQSPGRLLSTVQIGITLIGIVMGAFGGTTLAQKLTFSLQEIPVLASYASSTSLGITVLAIGVLSLVLGELVPKNAALSNPERIAAATAPFMRGLSILAGPAVALLNASSALVVRVLGIRPSTEPPVTEEEVKVLIEQGTQVGVFEEAEQDIVERVFRLGDRRVSALMVPRTDIVWLDIKVSPEAIRHTIVEGGHSLYPICRESVDNIAGVAHETKSRYDRETSCRSGPSQESERAPRAGENAAQPRFERRKVQWHSPFCERPWLRSRVSTTRSTACSRSSPRPASSGTGRSRAAGCRPWTSTRRGTT
jgi:putative hemolysin